MENKIYIIGTPIGNLEDISLRALKQLKLSDIILCEDTRVSQKLLRFYDISGKQLISYHNFNEKSLAPKIIDMILSNKVVSLISDAGMPCISDPGFEIISLAKKNNISVDVIGGPTALIHAVIKANFSSEFNFIGFLKDKSQARQNQLKSLQYGTYVCYVSPHKLQTTINDFKVVFGNNVKLFLIKEMTKLHEKSYEGNPDEILSKISEDSQKGEFSLVFKLEKPAHVKVNKYPKKN
ncbi:16S rRNA (cytidine(1402)-2'-O)-methyltransferase [Mycoplasma phocoeninasale]|uniref:16S rRNA (cytidine(1402)-2'-O)-methyltransferase n=1 Tax=Mycoplasma phocoeninasale TaxID=2726117 RepID=UPI001967009B|nr:16S rRNA (cytidine(1402)-2'-O)-methyltransferase [Mycoplasma phocoeninasale]MBN0970890.1 16S rRNA (cytidine(1402)-2'-O)-methyltransferase [Mycoplasma phocoeninasale]